MSSRTITHQYPSGRLEDAKMVSIYRAAAELIVEKGLDATSMSDIAKAVDLTKPGLYHHITGKKKLLFEIMEFAMNIVETLVILPASEIPDAEARLRFILDRHTGLSEYVREITILTDELPALNADDRDHIVARKRRYVDLLHETLFELKIEGKLRPIDVDIAVMNTFSAILGLSRWFDPSKRLSSQQVAAETAQFVLAGLLRDSDC